MTSTRRNAGSSYMQWAKLSSTAKHNLATSGIAGLPLSSLGVAIGDLEINGPDAYGYDPLLRAIASRYRVPKESVITALGTSFANYLAMAAITEPGDEVLIEHPTYDPLLSVARFLGLEIKRFQRLPEQGFAIDLADVERNLTSRTRVIVLCNLHNPSGAFTADSTLREIGTLARKNDAYVFVDEVYKEMLFEPTPQSAFLVDPERFIVTNSLTKAYGLSGIRCGWILAPPQLAQRMWHLHDIHAGTYVYPAELLSTIAFAKLPEISVRAQSMLNRNRGMLRDFLSRRNDLEYFWPEYGTVVFPRLTSGNVDEFCKLLRNEFDTTVVPGRFFEYPDRFRIGVGIETESARQSLAQLERGFEHYHSVLAERAHV